MNISRHQIRDEIVAVLLQLPQMSMAEGRALLLQNMDPVFVASVARSAVARDDLHNIVNAAMAQVDEVHGRWGLATLLANALDLAENSQAAPALQGIRDQLIPAPGRINFSLALTLLPVPTEQYVASPCEVEPPVGGNAVPLTGDDRVYLKAVRQLYSEWRDEPESRYISGKITPQPAVLVAGEVIHRQMPTGVGSTLQLWSWCKANHELMDHQRLLILGRPGIGKTSLIRFLARRYTVSVGTILPIIISLRTWRDPPDAPRTLVQFMQDFLRTPIDSRMYPNGAALADNLPQYLEDADQQARLVFLLDDYNGLARNNAADYERRWQEIRAFANQYTDVTIAVISRVLDYDGHLEGCQPEFNIIELNRWGPGQVTEYLRRNAPQLLLLAEERWFMDLADIPVQLTQMVDLLRVDTADEQAPALTRVFKNAHEVLNAFVDRLFTFSEQLGRGDESLRARVRGVLNRFAAGLKQDQKSGSYVDYAQMLAYLGPAEPTPDMDRILATAIDATILDMMIGVKQVGFEAQQLEDYFAESAVLDPYTQVTAHLSSGQPDGALRATEEADQAGFLSTDAPAS